MLSRNFPTLVALALLASSPLVGAWGSKGGAEPDTARDASDGWMFPTADVGACGTQAPYCATNDVYLNGFYATCSYPQVCLDTTANLEPLGTNVRPSYDTRPMALLGVWKDCNADGYIGLEEQGLFEYRSEVLHSWPGVGDSICPPTTTPTQANGKPVAGWFPSHNDGRWVREFIPIQWNDLDSKSGDINPYNLNDNGARVWLDAGLPEDPVTGASLCAGYPQPAGTFRSTGGVLWSADCRDGDRVTKAFDQVADANDTTRPYSFSDHPRDQYASGSKLNQKNPWGNEKDASDAQVWDCSQPQPVQHQVSNGGLLGYLWVNASRPALPPGTPASGSPAGTANATASGFDQCSRPAQRNGATHAGNAAAGAPYALEGTGSDSAWKISTIDLAPIEFVRPAAPWSPALGPSTPPGLGQQVVDVPLVDREAGIGADGLWSIGGNTLGVPTDTTYTTFYAYVTPTGLDLPNGANVGTYGAEACGGSTTGIHHGWDCDITHWYKDALGEDAQPRTAALGPAPGHTLDECDKGVPDACAPYGAFPGSAYDLRDIDCVDQDVAAARDAGIAPVTTATNLARSAQGQSAEGVCH